MPAHLDREPGYYIVQRSRRVDKGWRQEVAALGHQVVGYLPEDALLVKAGPRELGRISRLEGVRWFGRYLPEYKVSPSLGSLAELRHAGIGTPEESLGLLVSVFPGCDVREIGSEIEAVGCQVQSLFSGRMRSFLRVRAAKSKIPSIARMEDVEWIERFSPFVFAGTGQTQPLLAEPDIQVQIINAPEVWAKGLTGEGEVVAICDTGLDVGVNGTAMHDDFEGRIEAAYALGRPGLWNDPDGHGTHVAGTAVGNGLVSDGAFRAAAYESRLVFQSGYVSEDDPLGGVPVNLYDLFAPVYSETSARIHSDSWGSPDRSAYSLFSVQTDEFVWDHKDFLIVFAAGNDGVDVDGDGVIDLGSLYSPATAKNCIAVGASENVRDSGGLSGYTWGYLGYLDNQWAADPIANDYVSDNENGMAAFSSRGPCLDGRIKPDVVAPGTDIISCRSQDPQGKQSTELTSWGVYDDYYVYMGGTSMAAPAVASSAAVVRQFYTQVKGVANPSAALIKATLINGAADMTPGQYGTGAEQEMPAAPNYVEGWGRVDLKGSLYPEGEAELQLADETDGLETGESATYRYVVGTPEVPFRATMVYSDYPASPAAAVALVNDLDLTVTIPDGEIVYPNGLDGPDGVNNVEAIYIASPAPGIYTVAVSGNNIPRGPQPYAIVITCGKATGRAALTLGKVAYGLADGAVGVMLVDADLGASSAPLVRMGSNTDPVGVTAVLSQSSMAPGVFEGSVVLNKWAPPVGGQTLDVAHGDTVLASYLDANYGGGGQREVTATATVDLIPPGISDLSVSNVTEDSATLTWQCSEATTGIVTYGIGPALGLSAVDRNVAQYHSLTLRGLSENQKYYFAVRARDQAGNEVVDDNGGQLHVFRTQYTVIRFGDDMEAGEGGWTHSGDVDQWKYGKPTYENGPGAAHSGDFCWGTGMDTYLQHDDFLFGTIRDEYLVSPQIDVGTAAKLTFWHWHDLLAEAFFGIYDYGYVEVSIDGNEWQNVTPNADGAYTGASPRWIKEEIDLWSFAGKRIWIRFHVQAETWFDDLGPDYQYAGWYVDDVMVSLTRPFGEPTLTLGKPYATTVVPLQVTLVDGDLNRDPATAEVATVTVRSTTETTAETFLLSETGENTGVFSGQIILSTGSPVHGDGKIQAAEGDTLTVSYTDVEGALSAAGTTEASALVDLTPPAIGNLMVEELASDRATVSFTTEPTALAAIAYWVGGGQEESQVSHRRSAQREFVLPNLVENTLYRFRISVTDEAGNTAVYSSPVKDYSFGTKAEMVVASNGFDGGLSTWEFSTDGVWEIGVPVVGPPTAHSPPNCWGTDLDGYYPINCNASLMSDWVTLPENPELRFWHWYSIDELGWEGAFGTVEVTTDGTTWESASAEAFYAGASGGWLSETIDLSTWAGQRARIRFRLWSQEGDIVIYYYAGWYVDDVAISDVVPYGKGALVLDRNAYSFTVPVVVTLVDGHLNIDPSLRDSCQITLSSSLETITVQLVETDVSSGRFVGQVYLKQGPPAVADEYLQVAAGDSVVARYHDVDNGAGGSGDVVAAAPLDITPPVISGVAVSETDDTSALVTWTTDVEAIGSVSYAESPSGPFSETLSETSYSRQHSIRITSLSENLIYYVRVYSADRAANLAMDDDGGSCYEIRTMVRCELFHDGFDREDAGWTHEGLGDVWQWGVPQYGVMFAHSPEDCWATNLTGTYPGLSDASLISPPLTLKEGSGLTFWHWYSINEYLLDEGQGIVEIKPKGGDWTPLDGQTFSGALTAWERQEFDLSSYGKQTVQVRFRLQANQWLDFYYPGWYIDDVTIDCLRPFGFGVVQLDRRVFAIPGPVVITLKDGHLNRDIALKEKVEVSISSTSEPSGRILELEETRENSAVFVGEVLLRHVGEPAGEGLVVQYGDTIAVSYRDADNAIGQSDVLVTASARVWRPPEGPIVPTISYHPEEKPPTVVVAWPYEAGRVYRLYYCEELSGNPPTWERIPGVPELQGESFLGYTEAMSPLLRKHFYRVRVW
jgi:subtilisin family serine protease